MRGPDHKQSSLFSYTNIEDRIAVDHPLRRVKVMADMVLHSMSPTFDSLYAEGGRPSIAPERLLRALLLQCLFSIRSERALIEHLDFNMMFRWFVGLSQDEPVWDHSSFSANRDRLFKESVMREFFGGVVAIAEWAELISDEHFSVDGSLLRAWASHKSLAARDGSDEPPGPDQGNAPNLSPLICQMLVRLDASWPGVTSIRLDLAAGTRDGIEHGLQLVSGVFERQEAAGEDRLEGALGVGSIGARGGVGRLGLGAE